MKKKIRIIISIFALSFIIILIAFALTPKNQFCTIFTLNSNGTVIFGSNEDWHSDDLYLGIYPGADGQFGSLRIGYRDGSNQLYYNSAINEHGLIWAVNSLPKVALTPHPERPYSHASDNFLTAITHHAQAVDEAISLARQFDFGKAMEIQIHIADNSGDAVIISPGPDGELAFTRMDPEQGFLISSNFNHAYPGNGKQGWRYDTAFSMLSQPSSVSAENAHDVLSAVRLNNLTTFTLISSVTDLKKNEITFYYLSQFSEGAAVHVTEYLQGDQRIISLEDLFSPETVQSGKSAYRSFEIRFRLAIIAFILAVILLIILVIYIVQKQVYRRRNF